MLAGPNFFLGLPAARRPPLFYCFFAPIFSAANIPASSTRPLQSPAYIFSPLNLASTALHPMLLVTQLLFSASLTPTLRWSQLCFLNFPFSSAPACPTVNNYPASISRLLQSPPHIFSPLNLASTAPTPDAACDAIVISGLIHPNFSPTTARFGFLPRFLHRPLVRP